MLFHISKENLKIYGSISLEKSIRKNASDYNGKPRFLIPNEITFAVWKLFVFFSSFKQAFCSIFGINLECQEIRTIPSLLIAINFAFCLYCCLKFSPLENWDFYRCSSAYAFQSYTHKNCNSSSINLIRLIFSLWIKISNAHLVKLIFEHATLLIGLASFFRYQIIWRSYFEHAALPIRWLVSYVDYFYLLPVTHASKWSCLWEKERENTSPGTMPINTF